MNGESPMFGRIREFHSYARQDHAKHKDSDSVESARKHIGLNDPDAIDAGKQLRQFFDREKSWSDVEQYLSQCVFVLEDENKPSSAGANYLIDIK